MNAYTGTNLDDPSEVVELAAETPEEAAFELLQYLGWAVTK